MGRADFNLIKINTNQFYQLNCADLFLKPTNRLNDECDKLLISAHSMFSGRCAKFITTTSKYYVF